MNAMKSAKTAKPQITNVHVDTVSYDGKKAAAGFNYLDGKFHIWFDPQTMKAETTLHKNLINPPTLDHHRNHKSLDASNKTNAPLLAAMWGEIAERGLVSKALADKKAAEAREAAETENARREHLKEKAGPALFDLLAIIVANARVIPDPAMNGSTDIYAVPLRDLDVAKVILSSINEAA